MRRKARSKKFLKELQTLVGALKKMKPGETHVLNVNASYGHYQIVIGPGKKSRARGDERPIEIDGEIHHLFVTPEEIRAHPSRGQMMANLRDTVIMRGLHIHLMDPMGDGEHLSKGEGNNGLHAKEYINLAGDAGEEIIERVEKSDEISFDMYRIVQQDIIKALKENKRKSLEEVT